MSVFNPRSNPTDTRPKVRAISRSFDRDVTLIRRWIFAGGFTVLLAVVLAHAVS